MTPEEWAALKDRIKSWENWRLDKGAKATKAAHRLSTVTERCAKCGGEFSRKRIIIDGSAYHDGCSIMSYPPHTPEDASRMSGEIERLRAALKPFAYLGYSGLPNQGDIDHARAVYEQKEHESG